MSELFRKKKVKIFLDRDRVSSLRRSENIFLNFLSYFLRVSNQKSFAIFYGNLSDSIFKSD